MKELYIIILLILLVSTMMGCGPQEMNYDAYQQILDEVNAEYDTYLTFENLTPNSDWSLESYREYAISDAQKIVQYREKAIEMGTTLEELLKDFDDKMGAVPEE